MALGVLHSPGYRTVMTQSAVLARESASSARKGAHSTCGSGRSCRGNTLSPGWPAATKREPSVNGKGTCNCRRRRAALVSASLGDAVSLSLSTFAPDQSILGATASAVFKIVILCIAVVWMMQKSKLPPSTPQVLSQVAFQLTIPCMLFSKTVAILSTSSDFTIFMVPVAAALQILIGQIFGLIGADAVEGKSAWSRFLLGWQPLGPSPSAAAVARSMATAVGNPWAAPALMPEGHGPPAGVRQLVQLSCAFGNSVTLPLVFLLTLLSGAQGDRAVAYTALFLLTWSPAFWTLGFRDLSNPTLPAEKKTMTDVSTVPGSPEVWSPLTDNPQEEVLIKNDVRAPRQDMKSAQGQVGDIIVVDDGTWQEKLERSYSEVKKRLRNGIEAFLKATNPPVQAVLAGVVVGLSPLAGWITGAKGPAMVPGGGASWDFSILLGGVRATFDLVDLVGGATLVLQAVVLASSLFTSPPPVTSGRDKDDMEEGTYVVDAKNSSGTAKDIELARAPLRATGSGGFWDQLRLHSEWERRYLLVVGVVRLLLVPAATCGVVLTLRQYSLLPNDPVCLLTLLVQSAMPPAQNLVLMMQLIPAVQKLTTVVTKLLLLLYLAAIFPLSLWINCFSGLIGKF